MNTLLALLALISGSAPAEPAPDPQSLSMRRNVILHVCQELRADSSLAAKVEGHGGISLQFYSAAEEKPMPWVYDRTQDKRLSMDELGAVYIVRFSRDEPVEKQKGGVFYFVCSADDARVLGVYGEK